MKTRQWISLLLALCCLFLLSPSLAEEPGDFDMDSLESMRVVHCKEWVSLRKTSDPNSRRLAKVPLDAVVSSCIRDKNGMIFCKYEDQYGFIMEKYLEPFWKKYAAESYCGYASFPVSLSLLVDEGDTELDWEKYGVRVLANHYEDSESGEFLLLGVFAGEAVSASWSYMLAMPSPGELQGLTAFIGGTPTDPRVMVYHADRGLYMLDLVTGEIQWTLPPEVCPLGGNNTVAVSPEGIIYMAGYQGPHPVAISPDGQVLWESAPDDDRLLRPHAMTLTETSLDVTYAGPEDDQELIASFDLSSGRLTGVKKLP